jgi:hypothetical protein
MAVSFSRMSLSLAGGVGELRPPSDSLRMEGRAPARPESETAISNGVAELRPPRDTFGLDTRLCYLIEISSRHRQSLVGNGGRHRFLKCSQGRGIRNVR